MPIQYWFESPYVLFDKKDIFDVIPSNLLLEPKNSNAIVRLSIYSAIVLFIITNNKCFLFLPCVSMITTYIWYVFRLKKKEKEEQKEEFKNITRVKKYTMPTDNNPFMNFDYVNDSCKKKKAPKVFVCDTDKNIELRKDIESKFDLRLYKDTSDIFQRRNSQREFYTRAYQCVPDQTSFSKWCFQTGPTCKEKGLYCGQPSL